MCRSVSGTMRRSHHRIFIRTATPNCACMNPADIAKGYDQLAALWNGEAFPRTNGIPQHERSLAFVQEKRRALDVGCGSSGRIIELLLGWGFVVEGVDI